MVAPRSSTTESPRSGRPYRRDRRAVDAGQRAQVEPRHRHQRAGIAGGDRDVGLALLDRVDRKPHRGGLAAAAQRLARLVVHADGDVGMDDARGRLQRRMLGEFRLDQRAVAEQQEFGVGMPGQRDRGAGNDDRCADIATHGVKRDSNLLRHERPGNLISVRPSKRSAADWKSPRIGGDRRSATLRPGRAATIACPRPDTTS